MLSSQLAVPVIHVPQMLKLGQIETETGRHLPLHRLLHACGCRQLCRIIPNSATELTVQQWAASVELLTYSAVKGWP